MDMGGGKSTRDTKKTQLPKQTGKGRHTHVDKVGGSTDNHWEN